MKIDLQKTLNLDDNFKVIIIYEIAIKNIKIEDKYEYFREQKSKYEKLIQLREKEIESIIRSEKNIEDDYKILKSLLNEIKDYENENTKLTTKIFNTLFDKKIQLTLEKKLEKIKEIAEENNYEIIIADKFEPGENYFRHKIIKILNNEESVFHNRLSIMEDIFREIKLDIKFIQKVKEIKNQFSENIEVKDEEKLIKEKTEDDEDIKVKDEEKIIEEVQDNENIEIDKKISNEPEVNEETEENLNEIEKKKIKRKKLEKAFNFYKFKKIMSFYFF